MKISMIMNVENKIEGTTGPQITEEEIKQHLKNEKVMGLDKLGYLHWETILN